MDLDFLKNINKKDSIVADYLFYFSSALLIIVVFSYSIISVKIYIQEQAIKTVMHSAATAQEREYEDRYFDYLKKIEDFTSLINEHKTSSNVFTFIEEKTLPEVWFSNFDLSETENEVRLSGEAENVDILSKQMQLFEESEYITDMNILNSQTGSNGRVKFILNIYLDPRIFGYSYSPSFSTPNN